MKKNSKNKEKLKIANNIKKEVSEFKNFIFRGTVVDMAIGVIVGGAFGKIVSSLVNDILMPLIGIVLGGLDFSSLSVKINDANIAYGNFIQTIVDFLIIAFCIFVIIKIFEKFKTKEEKKKEEPVKSAEVILLEEIRDLLKNNK